jgi:putative CocE/NonD family hydrolase
MPFTQAEPAAVLPAGPISPRSGVPSRVVHGLMAPMRDGAMLATDLIRPDAPGRYPVVLVRTPYDKTASRLPFYWELAERGYIVAIQDCRGRFNSDGEFFPYRDERRDGYDAVEWVAAQPWCDGKVGMAGRSYVAQTQWFAAAGAPPHLKAIVPESSSPDAFFNEPILNGCFLLPMGEWMLRMGRRAWQEPVGMGEVFSELKDYFDALPLASLPERAGTTSVWWDEMMRHPTLDDLWRACSYQDAWPAMDVAALNLTGWWDMNFPGGPTNFAGLRRHGRAPGVRDNQHLVIGPWWHHTNEDRELNGVDFGPQAIVNLDQYRIRFYDRHLKGVANGIERDPRVHVFVLGANEWRTGDDWPLPDAEPTPCYFHSRGHGNSLKGDGVLSFDPPGDEPADAYAYDPADPVGMLWKLRDGPVDDRIPSIRDDVLCYTSEPLTAPLEVVGPVSCVLYASSSARDTDWHVRLVDVDPNGAARFLCHGALRARYRDGFETPRLLEPGEPTRFEFGMDAAGVRFLPGHRIRVEVMSSWFPEYDRNTNSGAENPFLDDEIVVAHQRVYHEPGRASHVVLPVIRR